MKKILIVEDSEIFARSLKTLIGEFIPESTILMADNHLDAIDILGQHDFDLITLDGNLLGSSHGRDVLLRMSPEQVKNTVVCSFEMAFLVECQKKNIDCMLKSGDLFEEFPKILEKKKIL
jgi:CheY-like chemotaxis protein